MNDLQRELHDIERRTRRYWLEDGLAEIFTAGALLLLGLYLLAEQLLVGQVPHVFINLLFPVLVLALAFGGRHLVTIAKTRYVYPRSGYVAYTRPAGNRYATALLAMVIAALMALLVSRAPLIRSWIPALEGLVFGVAFLSVAKKTGLARLPVEGLLTAVLGLSLSLLRLNENLASGLLFCGVGVVTVAGGIAAFAAYVRHAPTRGGEDA